MSIIAKNIVSVEQLRHDSTSWIGQIAGGNGGLSCGQTFVAPADIALVAVAVLPTIVTKPGKVALNFYQVDSLQKQWGNPIGTATVEVTGASIDQWTRFTLPGVKLIKGKTYGFRISCADGYMGIGETAGSAAQAPFENGQEWQFTGEQAGAAFSYFSLAFRLIF